MSSQQHILIVGLGVSGVAAARLARTMNAQVTVLDGGDNPRLRERADDLERRGCRAILGFKADARELDLPPVDLAVLSPGIPPNSALAETCGKLATDVIGEFEFGARQLSCPILAITGTNGKTTTTELTTHCLRAAGFDAVAAGNIGLPMSQVALESHPDVVVAEISSFQIETLQTFAPTAAAILNLSPDHLDRYPDFNAYAQAKLRLVEHVSAPERLVVRADLADHPLLQARWQDVQDRACLFSIDIGCDNARFRLLDSGQLVMFRERTGEPTPILHQSELKLKGPHNVENALAAAALCDMLAAPLDKVAQGLKSFEPSAHRLQVIGEFNNIRVINDSKSTNPDSLVRALETVAGDAPAPRIVLIAGGLGKNLDFDAARPALGRHVRRVFCIGESAERLVRSWGDAVDCLICQSFEKAVDAAVEYAVNGDTVLLSPGCASQDMFKDYAERGKLFVELITRRLNNG